MNGEGKGKGKQNGRKEWYGQGCVVRGKSDGTDKGKDTVTGKQREIARLGHTHGRRTRTAYTPALGS